MEMEFSDFYLKNTLKDDFSKKKIVSAIFSIEFFFNIESNFSTLNSSVAQLAKVD
jgi:hypothetical protein